MFLDKSRFVISIQGLDSEKLLSSIITNDISLCLNQEVIHSFLLSPQGKFIAGFFIFFVDNIYYLVAHGISDVELLKILKRYRLRYDCQIEIEQNLYMYRSLESLSSNSNVKLSLKDPRHDGLGYISLSHINDQSANNNVFSYDEYIKLRIQYKVAEEGYELISDKSFPLYYNSFKSISFSKGCYVGQEVTSRMYHSKSFEKKLLLSFVSERNINSGDDVYLYNLENNTMSASIGSISTAQDNIGLSLCKNVLDVVKNDQHQYFCLNDKTKLESL